MKTKADKLLDPQLWQACAGSMVQIPPLDCKVFYFPQGHAEHSQVGVDFSSLPPWATTSAILSRISGVKLLADPETDEVFARISLVPLLSPEIDYGEEIVDGSFCNGKKAEKQASFAKTLTQSDANNGGGFSVPRYCAETIFPRLNFSDDPPLQTLAAKDVHGVVWKFRHIYRGTPRRHLLTTGWSQFVNHKKLVAGDSIVFMRAENGDLCVGIRRVKRGIRADYSGWNANSRSDGLPLFLREAESKAPRKGIGKLRPEDVLKAATLAAEGQPFEVVYYPQASTPAFCVKACSVRAAMRIQWCAGMRFKMPFETDDSSRISWFMGTVSSVRETDPIRWPNSPWRLLEVTWDEPDMLKVKRVNPWLVELVSNMPIIHLSTFSPPRKKFRLPQLSDYPHDGQLQLSSFSGKPLGPSNTSCCPSDNAPSGVQGARHARLGLPLSDLQLSDKLQSELFLSSSQGFTPKSKVSENLKTGHTNSEENVSCLLTIGRTSPSSEKSDGVKRHQFLLFGQPIVTEQQISHSSQVLASRELCDENSDKDKISGTVTSALEKQNSLEQNPVGNVFSWYHNFPNAQSNTDMGHCKVFMQPEDIGRTLDLSVLGSYEELYKRLANIFGIDGSPLSGHVVYQDATGAVRQTGDEPFSVFVKTAKRLAIMVNPVSNGNVGRAWIAEVLTISP